MSAATTLWVLFFGSFGMGCFVCGKKRGSAQSLQCGAALVAFPYFITTTILIVVIGAAQIVVPLVLRTWLPIRISFAERRLVFDWYSKRSGVVKRVVVHTSTRKTVPHRPSCMTGSFDGPSWRVRSIAAGKEGPPCR